MSPPKKRLQCGVIGAGIAGLAAATALRNAGHNVEVFEKSSFKREVGAAITMTPNANLILDRWGLDQEKALETVKLQTRSIDPHTLAVIHHYDLSGVEKECGHKFNCYHRVDLHNAMRDIAFSLDRPGPVPQLFLSSEVTAIDCERGEITTKDGRIARKDLVVIANGIKTDLHEVIASRNIPRKFTKKCFYRALAPIDKLLQDERIRPLLEDEPSGFLSSFEPQSGARVVCYPCRSDQIMNMGILCDIHEGAEMADDWNCPATKEDALNQADKTGMNPFFRHLFEHATETGCYPISFRDVMPHMNRGKAIIIGDAAHPMMPVFAQGGSMSIEDAASLEPFFSSPNFVVGKDSVEKRLKLLNDFRMPRNCTTQLCSNTLLLRADMRTLIRPYWNGPLLPVIEQGNWGEASREFFYHYDVYKQAEKALKYKDCDAIPEGAIQHFGRGNS